MNTFTDKTVPAPTPSLNINSMVRELFHLVLESFSTEQKSSALIHFKLFLIIIIASSLEVWEECKDREVVPLLLSINEGVYFSKIMNSHFSKVIKKMKIPQLLENQSQVEHLVVITDHKP